MSRINNTMAVVAIVALGGGVAVPAFAQTPKAPAVTTVDGCGSNSRIKELTPTTRDDNPGCTALYFNTLRAVAAFPQGGERDVLAHKIANPLGDSKAVNNCFTSLGKKMASGAQPTITATGSKVWQQNAVNNGFCKFVKLVDGRNRYWFDTDGKDVTVATMTFSASGRFEMADMKPKGDASGIIGVIERAELQGTAYADAGCTLEDSVGRPVYALSAELPSTCLAAGQMFTTMTGAVLASGIKPPR